MDLSALTHVVECRWPHNSHWELIAGFNCERAALAYGGECHMTNLELAYRVRDVATGKTLVMEWT